jgi:uncharacterized membrane protein YqgA involved in biofilm formation
MTEFALWGTIVNTLLVLLGALVGLAIRAIGARLARGKESSGEVSLAQSGQSRGTRVADTVQKGLGLCVILIGMSGALAAENILVMIVSIVLGGLLGELCDLDGLLNRFGDFIQSRMKGKGGNIAEGFVSATLLFCVGAMTVTGALESGLLHTHTTYYAKGMIDMVAAVIFASSLGVGVTLSAAGVFVVQGSLTMIAVLAGGALPVAITGEIMAVGSLLVFAIGTNLLGVTKIRVMNLVPAMFFPIALCPLYSVLFG